MRWEIHRKDALIYIPILPIYTRLEEGSPLVKHEPADPRGPVAMLSDIEIYRHTLMSDRVVDPALTRALILM